VRRYLAACLGPAIVSALVGGCAGPRVRPTAATLSVYVTGYQPRDIARQAAVVRRRSAVGPTAWFIVGPVLSDSREQAAAEAERAVLVLNAAGVDAVLLDPGWLGLNRPLLDRLVSEARFYLLGANLADREGRLAGFEFMAKNVRGTRVAATGVWLDSVPGWSVGPAERTARRVAVLLRQRADVIGLLVGPDRPVSGRDFDFVAGARGECLSLEPSGGAGQVRRADLHLSGGVMTRVTQTEETYAGIEPDTAVARVTDSLEACGAGWRVPGP
jgi:hypothetical protein